MIVDRSLLRQRANKISSSIPRGFLRWAGSKRALLKHFVSLLPNQIRTYWEPFLGSGAMFFLLQPDVAHISDSCSRLVDVYHHLRNNPARLMNHLESFQSNESTYYKIRDNPSRNKLTHAAEFIFLNKTCWNGLYRVNSFGKFNVPYARPKSPFFVDRVNLNACSRALNITGVTIGCSDFEIALNDVKPGDFVYLDPPYVTRHLSNGFIDYNERLFSWSDQIRMAKLANKLNDLGANVIISNANHPDVIELYPRFRVVKIMRNSTIAANPNNRSCIVEIALIGSNIENSVSSQSCY